MRNDFSGVIRVNLIGLKVCKRIKPCRKGDIKGTFRPDNIDTNFKMTKQINVAIHTEQLISSCFHICSRWFSQFE